MFNRKNILVIVVYLLIFGYFPLIFGETPVNLLGLDSSDGSKNLIINLLSYSVITLAITSIIGFLFFVKVRWLISNFIVVCILSILLFLYIIVYFSLFWRDSEVIVVTLVYFL